MSNNLSVAPVRGRPPKKKVAPSAARELRKILRLGCREFGLKLCELASTAGFPEREWRWVYNAMTADRPLPIATALELIGRFVRHEAVRKGAALANESSRHLRKFMKSGALRIDNDKPPGMIVFPGQSHRLARVLAAGVSRSKRQNKQRLDDLTNRLDALLKNYEEILFTPFGRPLLKFMRRWYGPDFQAFFTGDIAAVRDGLTKLVNSNVPKGSKVE